MRVSAIVWTARLRATIASAVEPVAHRTSAAGRERACPGQRCEGRLVAHAARVGVADDGLRGADRTESVAVDETGSDRFDELVELAPVGLQRLSGLAQRHAEPADLVVSDGLFNGGVGGSRRRARATRAVSVRGARMRSRSRSVPVSSRARSRLVCAVAVVVSSWRVLSRMRNASRGPSARPVSHRVGYRRRPLRRCQRRHLSHRV